MSKTPVHLRCRSTCMRTSDGSKSDPFPAYIGIGKQYTGAFEERLCAANNRSHGVPDMPVADKPGF